MATEKLTLARLTGPVDLLDEALRVCLASRSFHIENAASVCDSADGYLPVDGSNIWDEPLARAEALCIEAGAAPSYCDDRVLAVPDCELAARVAQLSDMLGAKKRQTEELEKELADCEHTVTQLEHILDIDQDLAGLFGLKHIKLRFGHMPKESLEKLRLYDDNPYIVFVPGSVNKKDVWGFYFAPVGLASSVDEIFASLFFERLRLSSEIHGTPREAVVEFKNRRDSIRQKLSELSKELSVNEKSFQNECRMLYTRLKYLRERYDLRRYAVVKDENFTLVGWIPLSYSDAFKESAAAVDGLVCDTGGNFASGKLRAPTKLKNRWPFKPFEMFVKMYGVPGENEFDPTPVVALLYSLLFGAMFGDFGHGLVLIVVGAILAKVKKMELGRIMTVIGISSAVFGIVFGSAFGYEEAFDPMFRLFGLEEKPINVTGDGVTTTVLIVAIAAGALILLLSMVLNVINGIRQKNSAKYLFGKNGLAGIVFYASALLAVGMIMLFGKNLLTPWFVILFLVVPLVFIFLSEALGRIVDRKSEGEKLSAGEYVLQNIFEMIEVLLSYLSNTLSFIRVGAFVLSHAIMMSVVFMLAQSVSGAGNPVILVFGNIFVIVLEGLIVGIQVLRLQFYEIFGRFYSGGGSEFAPVTVEYDK